MMNLREYQAKARSTAIYLKVENNRMLYPALGIIGECGEVAEKIKKLIRDANGEMTPERVAAIAKELGDCCWYVANICCDTDHDLAMMYEMRGSSILHQVRKLSLPRLALHMNRHATAVATLLERWYKIFEPMVYKYYGSPRFVAKGGNYDDRSCLDCSEGRKSISANSKVAN
ncbi:MAG: hypothetical protein DRJ03_00760 [Chloroflexi bacterium]|nr:MAG: hypothetical protein DRJ03_00760 [Chloroflexota bacterium]